MESISFAISIFSLFGYHLHASHLTMRAPLKLQVVSVEDANATVIFESYCAFQHSSDSVLSHWNTGNLMLHTVLEKLPRHPFSSKEARSGSYACFKDFSKFSFKETHRNSANTIHIGKTIQELPNSRKYNELLNIFSQDLEAIDSSNLSVCGPVWHPLSIRVASSFSYFTSIKLNVSSENSVCFSSYGEVCFNYSLSLDSMGLNRPNVSYEKSLCFSSFVDVHFNYNLTCDPMELNQPYEYKLLPRILYNCRPKGSLRDGHGVNHGNAFRQSSCLKCQYGFYLFGGCQGKSTDGASVGRDLLDVTGDYNAALSQDSYHSIRKAEMTKILFSLTMLTNLLTGLAIVFLTSFGMYHFTWCDQEKDSSMSIAIFQFLGVPVVLSHGKPSFTWILVAGVFLMTSVGSEALVHLQADDIAHAESGLTWHHTLPSLKTFTFCVRLYSYRTRYSDYFFSYAIPNSDNELAFHIKYHINELRMACCAKRVFHIIHVDLKPLRWFSFCAAVDFSSMRANVVHSLGSNERPIEDSRSSYNLPLIVNEGGTVILGQDQDEPGGGTDKEQSFNGLMSDLYLTEDVLTKEEMSDYIQCKRDAFRSHIPLMDFSNITHDFTLGHATEEKPGIESCPGYNKIYAAFPEARTFKEAKHFCSNLNGQMALPLNDVDNLNLYNEGYKYSNKCTEFEKSSGMWVGVEWNPWRQLWLNSFIGEKASYNNFEVVIAPVGNDTLCTVAQTLSDSPDIARDGNWDIEMCDRGVCTACEFEDSQPLKIRGLCEESIFDRDYYIYDRINGRPVFNGKSWTKIAWNNSQSAYDFTWVLYQIAEPNVQARMVRKSELEYPIGVHEYEVVGDKCPGKKIKLKLTSCPQGMYTCNDGSCIDISKRCNLELDCADRGDELDCDTVILPSGYDRRLPPPKTDSLTPAQIDIDFVIRLIRKFSLLDSHLVVDLVITRSWYDSRVRYKNLHDSKNLNLIDDIVDVIWFPDVTLLGADNSIANYDLLSTTGWGQRLTEPEPDDENRLDEDVFYSGHGNLLKLEREITVTMMCTFDLTMYPFDSQRCPLIFYVGDYTQHYVSTVLNKVEFSGTKRLLEYRVTSIEHESLIYQNKSGQQIEIVLTNLYGYFISGAYIPTLLLVIISYSTFYFSLEDFTNRIMVSLTSLLVLASLFSQIASALPKTAYMKLIDVWFIFCILSDFVMVMLLTIINTISDKRRTQSPVQVFSTNGYTTKASVKMTFSQLDPKLCNKIAQAVLPAVLGLFIIVYFSGIAYSLNNVKDTL